MEKSSGNGYAEDGMDGPKGSAPEIDPSNYTLNEETTNQTTDTNAYTEPEENLVNIETVGLGAISVRARPPKGDWFRSHPDGVMSTGMVFIKGKMDELHAIRKELIPVAGPEVSKALIKASVTACVTIDGAKFLWAIIHPSGNANQQHYENALEARSLSRSTWIRFYWDANQESHVTVTPKRAPSVEPKWPEGFTLN